MTNMLSGERTEDLPVRPMLVDESGKPQTHSMRSELDRLDGAEKQRFVSPCCPADGDYLNKRCTGWQQPCSKPCCECAKDGHWLASTLNSMTVQAAQHHLQHPLCPQSHRIIHLRRISISHRPLCQPVPIHQCQTLCIQLQSYNPRWDQWRWLILFRDLNPRQSLGHTMEARMGICAQRSCERTLIVWLKSPLLHRKSMLVISCIRLQSK